MSSVQMDAALRKVQADEKSGTCSIIIFGGSGDLTRRKILPALFQSAKENLLPENYTIVGVGLPAMSTEEYRKV
ncbi:glucose-6-phosphate dehydrogenase, partial [bacterium]|nr:glucose-6-phosphate dehydrogenase [bacterium]